MKNQSTKDIISQNVESILDSLPEGVFISDAHGVSLRVNRMYEQLTGLTQEQISGKNVRTLVEDGIFDCILNPEIVKTLKPTTRVQRLKNGKRLVLSGFPVFNNDGELKLVVTFARDVTLLAQMQEQFAAQSALIEQINDQLAYVARNKAKDQAPVYQSKVMTDVVKLVQQFAPTDATLLILGETGAGKDVLARYAHSLSNRREKLMVKVDCGGISESLIESELFGYMPGAFTGASSKGKAGYFEIADGSTVFLDEIGELPLTLQTRLLRVLQDNEIVRIGSSQARKVNVRIIAATNRNLLHSVEQGTFRRDLFYRLNVASIQIPPLRERTEDIPILANHYLTQYQNKYHKKMAFMDVTLDLLKAYAWPGNVRELQNLVHSLVISLTGPIISPHDLPQTISNLKPHDSTYSADILTPTRSLRAIVADMERDFLVKAIEVHGSIQRVAELFGVNRSTIFRKLHLTKSTTDAEENSKL
ncbi:MAG: sigma 54-interacting transcriptional regulator [Desulfovibrionaceae bacterium]|nr:sigma 54-interacting transcriptional regulator [Desulfovibrionaceae bacterium]